MEHKLQDVSRQVLKRVIVLVKELEDNLVSLVTMASRVELVAGLQDPVKNTERPAASLERDSSKAIADEKKTSSSSECKTIEIPPSKGCQSSQDSGPQVYPPKHSDVVSGQDEADALLSNLGF